MPARGPWDDIHDELHERIGANAERADDASCIECERPIGETGRWYSDGTGSPVPYCASCAAVEFPVL